MGPFPQFLEQTKIFRVSLLVTFYVHWFLLLCRIFLKKLMNRYWEKLVTDEQRGVHTDNNKFIGPPPSGSEKWGSSKIYEHSALSGVSSPLTYQQKKKMFYQTLSSVKNLVTVLFIWILSSIRSYKKIKNMHERSLRLYQNDYTYL